MNNNQNCLISIITINYNNSKGLESTIHSVINQTYKNIEFIIIDGGSKDGSLGIIKKYQDNLSYWVSEADNGVFNAMNKGIKLATGDWVIFMNSGDIFSCDISSIFHDGFIDDDNLAIIYGDNIFRDKVNKALSLEPISFGHIMACHQSMFFKNEPRFTIIYSEKFKYYSEYELVARLYIQNYDFLYVPLTISTYEDGGISSTLTWGARIPKYFWIFKYFGIKGVFKSICNKIGIIKLDKYRFVQ